MSTRTRRANGEGSKPVQRKDGRWQVNFSYTDDDGVRHRKSVTAKTAKDAREKAKAALRRVEQGQPVRDSRSTVGGYAETWVGTTLANSDRRASTKSLYKSMVDKHVTPSKLGGMPLAKVKPSTVEGWVAGLRRKGLADSSVRTAYTVLRAVFDAAVRDGELGRNPVAAVKRPTVEREEAAHLSPDQVRELLEAVGESRYRPVFELLVNTGLRRGEALALTWRDVDEKKRLVRVRGTLARQDGELVVTRPKTDRSVRVIHMTDRVAAILSAVRVQQKRERLQAGSKWVETGFVFTTPFGTPCDPRNTLRALQSAAERVGMPGVGLHTLRHSAASTMLANGVPMNVVSEILGHSSISITVDVYGHVSPEVSASAMESLSGAFA